MRHQTCGTASTVAGSASPSRAMTNTSRPALRQLSIRWPGRPPLPAMMPSGPWVGAAASAAIRAFLRGGRRLAQRAARIGADKRDDVGDRADRGKALGRLVDPVAERAVVREQKLVGAAQPLDLLAGEAAALDADDVEAG